MKRILLITILGTLPILSACSGNSSEPPTETTAETTAATASVTRSANGDPALALFIIGMFAFAFVEIGSSQQDKRQESVAPARVEARVFVEARRELEMPRVEHPMMHAPARHDARTGPPGRSC